MSYMDYPRSDYAMMGTTAYDGVVNRAGDEHDDGAAHTIYASAPPRVPPDHVVAAKRRAVQIDAMSGQAVYDSEDERLKNLIDDHLSRKSAAMAQATNAAIQGSPSTGGHLGAGLALNQPAGHILPWVLHGAGI